MKKTLKKYLLIWIGVPLIAWYISANWYQLMMIQGKSMYPAYNHLQVVLLNKHENMYRKGNVIAFSCQNLSSVLVKRIVAGPGDTAVIQNGTLIVNGCVSEIYPTVESFSFAGLLAKEVALKDEQFLVIGDNTEHSIDSRYQDVSIVEQKDIVGVVCGS